MNMVLACAVMVTSCFGQSPKMTVKENVTPRVPSSICKSFSDKTDGTKKRTWCDYFESPQSHPCTEVSIDDDSGVKVCYFDPTLPANPLAGTVIPTQKGGLVAELVKEKESGAVLAFKAYVYTDGSWKVAAEGEGRLLDGMGENSYYISSGKFMSTGEKPGETDEQYVWTVNKGETAFSRTVGGKLRMETLRNEEGGHDRWYYESSGKIRSESKYKAIRDYDRLFGEEFIRYEELEKVEYPE